MSRSRRSFDPAALAALRSMTVAETPRLYVAVGAGVVELVVTGARWYDTRAKKGGGGAIDLTMHLCGLDFVGAVKRLS